MNESDILSDFRRRYDGTYVFVQEPNSAEKSLFLIQGIESSASKIAVLKLQSDEVGSIRLNYGSQHSLHFCVPPVGVFQYGPDALVCMRNPRKQYRRGLCSDNTMIYSVAAFIASTMSIPLSWAVVNAAFEHKIFSLKEGLSTLEKGKHRSVALANNMALSLSTTDVPEHILFHGSMPIARVNSDGKATNIYEKIFESQINAYLQKELYGTR